MEDCCSEETKIREEARYTRINNLANSRNISILTQQYKGAFEEEEVERSYYTTIDEILGDGFWERTSGFVPVLAYMRTQELLDEVLYGVKRRKIA